MGRVLTHLIAIKGSNCFLVIEAGSYTRGGGYRSRYSDSLRSENRIPVGGDFPHPSIPALGPPSLVYNGHWVFPGGKATGA